MKTVCLFVLLANCYYSTKLENSSQNRSPLQHERKLAMPFGSSMLAAPHVSPPPPIFDTGLLPIQPVFNLMQFPHQYSSPMVDYAYPTVFNPYYNHLLPYGMGGMYSNPHILASMGMYGIHPHTQSMYQNGFFGMLPYQNANISGMEHINNSAQNDGQQGDGGESQMDRRLIDQQKMNKKMNFINSVSNQWQNAYSSMMGQRYQKNFDDVQHQVFQKFRNDLLNKRVKVPKI